MITPSFTLAVILKLYEVFEYGQISKIEEEIKSTEEEIKLYDMLIQKEPKWGAILNLYTNWPTSDGVLACPVIDIKLGTLSYIFSFCSVFWVVELPLSWLLFSF